ncbi:MAG: retroviral-like aspartic protease family protein, partial [Duganella sp.]
SLTARTLYRLAASLWLTLAALHGHAAAAASAAPAASPTPTAMPGAAAGAQALLAQARAAVGGDAWRTITTQQTQFVRSYLNHDESGSSDIDFVSGRYAQRIPTSAVARQMSRSDGRDFWQQRMGRMEKLDADASNPEQYLRRQSYGWWFARGKARSLTLRQPRQHQGVHYAVVRVAPERGSPFDFWINTTTGRVERRQEVIGDKTFTIDYRDFRRVGAVTLPFEESTRDARDERDEDVLRIASIVLNRPAAQLDFSLPQPAVIEGFTTDRPAVTVPFEPCQAHICVALTLNGQGPFRFILDTGARNVISNKLHRRLQLPVQGVAVLSGMGEQSERGMLTTVKQIGLAGLTLDQQAFFTSPTLDNLPIDGTIGYEWLSLTPTRIDYAARQITFHDPRQFVYRGPAAPIPLTFHDKTPQVAAVLDGLPGMFTIDTGSDYSLTMNQAFVERHGLVQKYGAGDVVQTAQGIGGKSRVLATQGKLFEIGDVRIADPTLELSTHAGGLLNGTSGTALAGNISNGILRQLDVLLDYQGGKVYLAPNKASTTN